MEKDLVLSINDFGPIINAKININQINVVAGINATGKSTISKILYSLLTAISKEGDFIANNNMKKLFEDYIFTWGRNYMAYNESSMEINVNKDYEELTALLQKWPRKWGTYAAYLDFYKDVESISKKLNLLEQEECKNHLNRIKNTIEENRNIYIQYLKVIKYIINTEIDFSQDHSEKTFITLKNDDNQNRIDIKLTYNDTNDITQTSITVNENSKLNLNKISNIIYVDSPSVLDLENLYNLPYHYKYLYRNLKNTENNIFNENFNKNLINIEEKIIQIINGKFKFNFQKNKFEYLLLNESPISISNVSDGFKQLGILQLLLSNQVLINDSLLIIDEPEVNLHQNLQVVLAELLVMISKELNIILYINSHSPIFIEAIELYTEKYGLKNDTNFYLAEKKENKYEFKYIPRNRISSIYENIGLIYDELDIIRAQNIKNIK